MILHGNAGKGEHQLVQNHFYAFHKMGSELIVDAILIRGFLLKSTRRLITLLIPLTIKKKNSGSNVRTGAAALIKWLFTITYEI